MTGHGQPCSWHLTLDFVPILTRFNRIRICWPRPNFSNFSSICMLISIFINKPD